MSPSDERTNSWIVGELLDILSPIQPHSLGNLSTNWTWNLINEPSLVEYKPTRSITFNLEFLRLEMSIGSNKEERAMWAELVGSSGSLLISPKHVGYLVPHQLDSWQPWLKQWTMCWEYNCLNIMMKMNHYHTFDNSQKRVWQMVKTLTFISFNISQIFYEEELLVCLFGLKLQI